MGVRREFSAGGVVYKKSKVQSPKSEVLWLIGKHSGYHNWVLPKGLIEPGERGFEAAVREVEEEMGVRASLVSEKPIQRVSYVYWADFSKVQNPSGSETLKGRRPKLKVKNEISSYGQSDEVKGRRRVKKYQEEGGGRTKVFKVVSFYLMEYVSGDPKHHDWEMEEAGWFSYEEAMEKLAFAGEREALRQAQGKLLEKAKERLETVG